MLLCQKHIRIPVDVRKTFLSHWLKAWAQQPTSISMPSQESPGYEAWILTLQKLAEKIEIAKIMPSNAWAISDNSTLHHRMYQRFYSSRKKSYRNQMQWIDCVSRSVKNPWYKMLIALWLWTNSIAHIASNDWKVIHHQQSSTKFDQTAIVLKSDKKEEEEARCSNARNNEQNRRDLLPHMKNLMINKMIYKRVYFNK